ncbi:hypothetical protein KC19_3G076000 [Ceratodon purpureus]|uniref:Uncharacterized protein n=1 Tax=Ceratodon purpureus TaxID=3225 RepID=A0A8T0IID6_CERPU|nr:hypothetical protein KC19_3G076000 [Ceratodon purpureus]
MLCSQEDLQPSSWFVGHREVSIRDPPSVAASRITFGDCGYVRTLPRYRRRGRLTSGFACYIAISAATVRLDRSIIPSSQ